MGMEDPAPGSGYLTWPEPISSTRHGTGMRSQCPTRWGEGEEAGSQWLPDNCSTRGLRNGHQPGSPSRIASQALGGGASVPVLASAQHPEPRVTGGPQLWRSWGCVWGACDSQLGAMPGCEPISIHSRHPTCLGSGLAGSWGLELGGGPGRAGRVRGFSSQGGAEQVRSCKSPSPARADGR